MFLLDARRLGRLRGDGIVAIAMLAVHVVAWLALAEPVAALAWVTAPDGVFGERGISIALRLLALLFFGMAYGLHRREQRSASLFGLPRPNPWPAALAAIAIGIAGSLLLASVLK